MYMLLLMLWIPWNQSPAFGDAWGWIWGWASHQVGTCAIARGSTAGIPSSPASKDHLHLREIPSSPASKYHLHLPVNTIFTCKKYHLHLQVNTIFICEKYHLHLQVNTIFTWKKIPSLPAINTIFTYQKRAGFGFYNLWRRSQYSKLLSFQKPACFIWENN